MLRLAMALAALGTGANAATFNAIFYAEGSQLQAVLFEAPSLESMDYSQPLQEVFPEERIETGGTIITYIARAWSEQFQFSISTDSRGDITAASSQLLGEGGTGIVIGFDSFSIDLPQFDVDRSGSGLWRIREVAPVPLPASGLMLLAGLAALRARR